MSSVKGKILRFVARSKLTRTTIREAEDVGGFRRLVLQGEVAPFVAGAKIQVLLPSDDVRTYTPIASAQGAVLLPWKHAGGPGAQWMAKAQPGDELLFLGPQRSLVLDPGPLVLVGDETSVAVAAALALERPGNVHAVIQGGAEANIAAAAAAVGLQDIRVVARGDIDAIAEAVTARAPSSSPSSSTLGDPLVVLTGGSELVLGVRDLLRRAGVQRIKTKTYWVPGKTGLD